MKSALVRWVLGWGVAGAVVAFLISVGCWLFGMGLQTPAVVLWPSSIFLMGLDGPTPRSRIDVLGIYAILIGENFILYCVAALFLFPIYWVLRRRWPA